MHIARPGVELTEFTHNLWLAQNEGCLNKDTDLKRLTTTATSLFKQAANVSEQHMPQANFQQHVTTISDMLSTPMQKSKTTAKIFVSSQQLQW